MQIDTSMVTHQLSTPNTKNVSVSVLVQEPIQPMQCHHLCLWMVARVWQYPQRLHLMFQDFPWVRILTSELLVFLEYHIVGDGRCQNRAAGRCSIDCSSCDCLRFRSSRTIILRLRFASTLEWTGHCQTTSMDSRWINRNGISSSSPFVVVVFEFPLTLQRDQKYQKVLSARKWQVTVCKLSRYVPLHFILSNIHRDSPKFTENLNAFYCHRSIHRYDWTGSTKTGRSGEGTCCTCSLYFDVKLWIHSFLQLSSENAIWLQFEFYFSMHPVTDLVTSRCILHSDSPYVEPIERSRNGYVSTWCISNMFLTTVYQCNRVTLWFNCIYLYLRCIWCLCSRLWLYLLILLKNTPQTNYESLSLYSS